MSGEAKRREAYYICREWIIRALSAIKTHIILHEIGEDFLHEIRFGFFDVLIGKNVILIAFRIPTKGEKPFFRIHKKAQTK